MSRRGHHRRAIFACAACVAALSVPVTSAGAPAPGNVESPPRATLYGVYGTTVGGDFDAAISELATAGFGMAVVGATREQLDVLSANGVKAVVGLGMTDAVLASDSAWDAYLADVRSKVSALREHPALLAWYVVDEPDGRRIGRPRIAAACDVVRAADPKTPLLTVLDAPDRWSDYLDLFDIVAVDPYLRRTPAGAFETPSVVTRWLEQLRTDLRRAGLTRRVWAVIGAFDLVPANTRPRAYLKPTPAQLAEMVARARADGVEGVLIYSYAFNGSAEYAKWRLRGDAPLWEAVKALPRTQP